MHWLHKQIIDSARDIARAGGTIRGFDSVVAERLAQAPLTDWELDRWTRGLGRRLIVLNSHWFRLGSGRQSSFSFFVRNEHGLMVGLRREAFTQAAVYVALVTDYGHSRRRVRFETGYLDVALLDDFGNVALYAETKAADRTLRKLIQSLARDFQDGLPPWPEEEAPPDPWQKAQHILRWKPRYFWAVSPQVRVAFQVSYTPCGFALEPVADIPAAPAAGLWLPGCPPENREIPVHLLTKM
jgi:hypothetical protein